MSFNVFHISSPFGLCIDECAIGKHRTGQEARELMKKSRGKVGVSPKIARYAHKKITSQIIVECCKDAD
jgi:hypothetical protein